MHDLIGCNGETNWILGKHLKFPSPKLPSLPTPLPLCPLPSSYISCKLSLALWTRLMRWRLMILRKLQSLIETNKKLQWSSWPTVRAPFATRGRCIYNLLFLLINGCWCLNYKTRNQFYVVKLCIFLLMHIWLAHPYYPE